MNQGELEMVKQEIARVNVNILGISELKWTGKDSSTNVRTQDLIIFQIILWTMMATPFLIRDSCPQ